MSFGQKSASGHFLVATWNETKATDGKIFSIAKHDPASDATAVESTSLPEGHIPGYATYFWFIPEDNIFATVRFQHVENGHQQLQSYMRGFLTFFSKYVVASGTLFEENSEILGYGESRENYDDKLHPYYRSKLLRRPGVYEHILSSQAAISKVIRRMSLSFDVQEDIGFWEKMMNGLGLSNVRPMNGDVPIEFTMKTTPSRNEVGEMIDQWRESHEESWDDIGFIIQGDDTTHWLSHDIPKDDFQMNIERNNEELVDTEDLLEKLDNKFRELQRVYQSTT